MQDKANKTAALFVTCLADLFRPSVAFAAVKLLQQAGLEVCVPKLQTCCGQPAYNTGAYRETRGIAKQVIEAFVDFHWVVAPSGSCAGMIKHHYPKTVPGGSRVGRPQPGPGGAHLGNNQFSQRCPAVPAPGITYRAG